MVMTNEGHLPAVSAVQGDFWKGMEMSTGHMGPEGVATEAFPK